MPLFDQDKVNSPGTTLHKDEVAEQARLAAEASPLEWEEDTDFARVSPAWFRGLRALLAVALIAFISFTAYNGIRGWFERQLDPIGEPGESIAFVVPSGATTASIGQLLQE